ncbi:hypothetical protein SERLA73DRAFT_79576 [Serpula lacrymans var. lacrymans S7.3]|uniref:Uncharacterized protein n=1 Tax=Serpula lacrymans var. lacrymans (strain S7.3) TaxID=936435 RepID=F8QGV8_SERL3|nr:hypothetical protein SERLA73DRAFT_79576 [Serpula lacrymans var. lacrymans S7.3]
MDEDWGWQRHSSQRTCTHANSFWQSILAPAGPSHEFGASIHLNSKTLIRIRDLRLAPTSADDNVSPSPPFPQAIATSTAAPQPAILAPLILNPVAPLQAPATAADTTTPAPDHPRSESLFPALIHPPHLSLQLPGKCAQCLQ